MTLERIRIHHYIPEMNGGSFIKISRRVQIDRLTFDHYYLENGALWVNNRILQFSNCFIFSPAITIQLIARESDMQHDLRINDCNIDLILHIQEIHERTTAIMSLSMANSMAES